MTPFTETISKQEKSIFHILHLLPALAVKDSNLHCIREQIFFFVTNRHGLACSDLKLPHNFSHLCEEEKPVTNFEFFTL